MNGSMMMDDYIFNNNCPVDVEATLNSLLNCPAGDPYDFSLPLLSSTTTTSSSSSNALLPHRTPPPPCITTATPNNDANSDVPPHQPFPEQPPPSHLGTNNTASQMDKRKRRRKDDILQDEVCKGFDWTVYQSPQVNFIVYDTMTMQPIGNNLDVVIYKSGANTHFSSTEQAWISYRQNQFKIFCLLQTPQVAGPMCMRDGAMDVDVQQFYVKLYAIKSTSVGVTEEVQVGLYHAGKSRIKKEKTEIVAIPFLDGRAEFTNLQFERSNAAKGQQEYFHLVVTLYAKTSAVYYPIISRISPRIIVRSQHPGFYGPPSPEPQLPRDTTFTNNTSTSNTGSEDSTSPKLFENDPTWQQSGADAVFRIGKVGINTSDPTEALTVHGNALITGNLYKPSDRRIKSDFVSVDSIEQLDHIRSLRIYDYKIKDRSERGVIAQELQVVMPPAVHEAGDVNINGVTVPNLLVVNERSLLYENIGATQQLDKHLQIEKSNIVEIDSRVDHLAKSTERDREELKDQIRSISDMFFAEEMSQDEMSSALREEQVIFGVNLFRMGPARSLMVLGYLVPYLWLIGSLYILSSIPSRRTLGRACASKFVVWWVLDRYVFQYHDATFSVYVYWMIGMALLLGNWRRNKKRMEERRLGRELEGKRSAGWKCWESTWLWRAMRYDNNKEEEKEEEEEEKTRLVAKEAV